ncbi:MAG: hypothetical protein NT091_04720 [Candidatus Falkowbacteria bacterium]|nr:hypothetical protein [Candidatus Falkowbacteria bacterium]
MENKKMELSWEELPEEIKKLMSQVGVNDTASLNDFGVKYSPALIAAGKKTARILLESGEKAMYLQDDYYGKSSFVINMSNEKEIPSFIPQNYYTIEKFSIEDQNFSLCREKIN